MTVAASWPIDRAIPASESQTAFELAERARDARHPISRWYLLPLSDAAARLLARTVVRPWHVTLLGCSFTACAVTAVIAGCPGWLAAAFVLAAWFCDRVDGKLARRQGTATPFGAWLDSNLDELADLGLHAAVAAAAAMVVSGPPPSPWLLFAAFVAGKYLFFHGRDGAGSVVREAPFEPAMDHRHDASQGRAKKVPKPLLRRARDAFNLPGNADVRTHLLVAALATNLLIVELAIVAAYYNLRWLGRYGIVIVRQVREGGAE